MAPTTRLKNKGTDSKATPEQKEKVVKVPTTTKRTIKKNITKVSTAAKKATSKKGDALKVKTEAEAEMDSGQPSGFRPTSVSDSQSVAQPEIVKSPTKKRGRKPKAESNVESDQQSGSAIDSQSEALPKVKSEASAAIASPAKKRGRKPKAESNVESSEPSGSQAIAQEMSVMDLESDSKTKPETKRAAKSKNTAQGTKKSAVKMVKPKANKKEIRRKIKASEIPGFSNLDPDMASRVVRVLTQRIFVLSRSQLDDSREVFEIIGSVGTTYTVRIEDHMSCNCVDYRYKRLHCKHILTVLLKVYRLHFSSNLFKSLNTSAADRKAAMENNMSMIDPSVLVSREAREKILNVMTNKSKYNNNEKAEQRPLDTSDCPVCFETFEPENINFIAFCFICGNNIHKQCLQQWIDSKGGIDRATCVYCRSPWVQEDQAPSLKSWRDVDADHRDGTFVNFAEEMNISRKRDQSSYGTGYLNFIE
ncbi:hypothetical protein K501DRAFT_68179 [Backusella circina FSU 941]|nr:hypothetical protein K501DRAFT_68179 [Backusella circina FSU 941]